LTAVYFLQLNQKRKMSKKSEDVNFSKSLKRLEEIVNLLENPDLDLEEGLKLLEEGVKLHKMCEQKLKNAQVKINEILAVEEVN